MVPSVSFDPPTLMENRRITFIQSLYCVSVNFMRYLLVVLATLLVLVFLSWEPNDSPHQPDSLGVSSVGKPFAERSQFRRVTALEKDPAVPLRETYGPQAPVMPGNDNFDSEAFRSYALNVLGSLRKRQDFDQEVAYRIIRNRVSYGVLWRASQTSHNIDKSVRTIAPWAPRITQRVYESLRGVKRG